MSNLQHKISLMQETELVATLKTRFESNMHRHANLSWNDVLQKLLPQTSKMWSLHQMEITGGEPDVIGSHNNSLTITFFDCATETPTGRRSICYDRQGWQSRKDNRPETTAIDMATEMGVTLLSEEQYRQLQTLGAFDLKTSSWLATPANIRALGGAIFADRRYDTVFVYHNGAQSYYSGRGFRAFLEL